MVKVGEYDVSEFLVVLWCGDFDFGMVVLFVVLVVWVLIVVCGLYCFVVVEGLVELDVVCVVWLLMLSW